MTKVMVVLLLATSIISWAWNDKISPSSDKIYHTLTNRRISGNTEALTDTSLGDVIFEMDVQAPTGDNQLLGVEFDGTYFYVSGGTGWFNSNKVYVIDTLGNVMLALEQPVHVDDYWGWRDLTWDGTYSGVDRIDTLYGSFNRKVDKFGINFVDSTLNYYGCFSGPGLWINRALAYKEDSAWFYTCNSTDLCYKFSKNDSCIQGVANSYHIYGAAYDTDILEGDYVWWHSQDSTSTPFFCLIEQMDAISMNFTGVIFDIVPTMINSGIAGGLCFYEGFRGMDVLFALVQGDPSDIIVGIFVRYHMPGIVEESGVQNINTAGVTPCFPNPTRGRIAISYTTVVAAQVSLQIYDKTGCLVKTLVNNESKIGSETVHWNGEDMQGRRLPSGVYFVRFETQGYKETEKIVLLR